MGERWQDRFRAGRMSLPSWAREAPDHALYRGNTSGTWEIHTWDRGTGAHRQVTERRHGTLDAALDPTGAHVWWFDDTDGDEFGVWRVQPFHGGPDRTAVPGLGPAYDAGLALGASGAAAVGRSTDDGFSAHLCVPGTAPRTVYAHRNEGGVAALSDDETLLAITHSEHGDSRHPAVRVLRLHPDGSATALADLWDGPGRGLHAAGFAPGGHRLLVLHERRGRREPLVWDPATGAEHDPALDLPGDLSADWTPDGEHLLILQDHRARSRPYLLRLATGAVTEVPAPPGFVSGATARPDGSVEYSWSSSARPTEIRSTAGGVLLTPPGITAPPSVPVRDVLVDGPGGPVHALVSVPDDGSPGPHPTVFLVHGGPHAHDLDAFSPDAAAWVDHGFAVVRVNYRGSTGYGSAWRDALVGRVGLTELEDVKAVRDWAVSSGTADPDRLVLSGGSWGGYLTLLALGVYPGDWTAGIAVVPIADYATAYADEMEALRAFDRDLFGGSPDDVPERYRRSSPLTYAADLTAPVLVLAGENDPRCPIRQIDVYLDRLTELGHPHEVFRFDAGHGSLVVEERIRHTAVELDFALRSTGARTGGPAPGAV
ncbi:alpha/beta hydrolase family protein [Nocardiopsis trehalosi]|uniref:alpha/beta hydrolase family protein n=1 Tax=Nocardiopsis trehalosi TaxID=109329 RepID=UPI000835DE81|nr:prolyl oligopeptidase family serine peptidase [Nocardiopsis trehalosi]